MSSQAQRPPRGVDPPGRSVDPGVDPRPLLAEKLGAQVLETRTDPDGTLRVVVDLAAWRPAAETLREAGFERLDFLSCVDWDDHFDLVLQAYSPTSRIVVRLVAAVARDGSAPSLSDLWPTVGWEEREAYDLFGLSFAGHPDLRRILNPESWDGHPLRRDYVDDINITRPQYF